MHATTDTEVTADFAAALESAKLQALYNFAYGLSHEINNPLANIATRAQTLLIDETDADRRRKLATIVQQAFRAHEMIADLMLFARPPALRREQVDLATLTDTVVAEVQEQAAAQDTTLLRSGAAGPLWAMVDPTQIAVALKALIQNSLEAVSSGRKVDVAIIAPGTQYSVPSTHLVVGQSPTATVHQPHDSSPPVPHALPPRLATPSSALRAPHFHLTVTDTGPGIPPEIRPHIFDPFFSGREAGRGLGLGLSKAWRIAELHGGSIEVESEPGSHTRLSLLLPSENG
jgi:hypothetical protein